jgi:glutathione S-transferase
MRFAEVEEAQNAPGVRLVVLAGVPSPWAEAAKGLFAVKRIDGLLVRLAPNDEAVKRWTGWHNAPVLFVDAEPQRMHWSEILEAAERLGGTPLVRSDPDERARTIGLAHELLGDGGLVWSARLVAIHGGLTSEGREGFPVRVARYLGAKYGYAPERADAAKARAVSILRRFDAMLAESRARGGEYVLPSGLSVLDVYLAASLAVLAPLDEARCPGMSPPIRHAFETGNPEVRASVTAALVEHRDRIYERHLGLPIAL